MRFSGFTTTLVAAALALTAPLAAQQPGHAPAKPHAQASGMMRMDMRMMDSLDARLDSAMARMNRSSGDARVAAMADALNALVAGHKAMHAHMREMGGGMGGMPGMAHPMPAMAHPMPGMGRPDSAARAPK